MGIRVHIFTARALIHLRQSRPRGHGITDGAGAGWAPPWAALERNKVPVPTRCCLPGTPGTRSPCRDKDRTLGLLQPKAKPSGKFLLPWRWGLAATLAVPVPLSGERRDKRSPILSPPSAASPGCAFHLFPGGHLGGKRGQRIPGRVLGVPEGRPGGAASGKEGGKSIPRFPAGFPHRAKRKAAGARWNRSPRPGEGSAITPGPGWGFAGLSPQPLPQLAAPGCVPHSASAGEREMSPCPRSASSRPLRRPPPVPLG